jgi:hypothetical protein
MRTYLLTHLPTYLLTHSMDHSPSWEANQFAAGQEIPRILWTRRFITAIKTARHLSLSWASPIQSIPPHPTSWRSILILSSHLHLGLPSGLFPSGFSTKALYTPLPSPIRATCPVHHILLDFINRTMFGEQYRSLSSLPFSFLHSPVTSSLLGPNILLNTLSQPPSAYVTPLMSATKFNTHTKQQAKQHASRIIMVLGCLNEPGNVMCVIEVSCIHQ